MKTEYKCFGTKYMQTKWCKECKVTGSCRREYKEYRIKKWKKEGVWELKQKINRRKYVVKRRWN